jgi:hypothetical protein
MLEILSLIACGWLLMINPSSNFRQEPLSQWEQSAAYDTAC